MAMGKDRRSKLIFAHPRCIASLIEEFAVSRVPGGREWVQRMDFASLERLPTENVDKSLRATTSDMLWRLRVRDRDGTPRWLHIIVLLEFQSTVDWFMALRVQRYATAVYTSPELAGGKLKAGERLPPLLAVVLYTGRRDWSAPLSLAGLLHERAKPAGEQERLRQRLFCGERYELIDINQYELESLLGGDLASLVIAAEMVETADDALQVLRAFSNMLRAPEDGQLENVYLQWFRLVMRGSGVDLGAVEDSEMAPRLRPVGRLTTTMAERFEAYRDRYAARVTEERQRSAARVAEERQRSAARVAEERQRRTQREHELLCLLVRQRFGAEIENRASELLASVGDASGLREAQSWILACESGRELLRKLEGIR